MIEFLLYLLIFRVSFRIIYKAVYNDLYGNAADTSGAEFETDESSVYEAEEDPAYDEETTEWEDGVPDWDPVITIYRHTA